MLGATALVETRVWPSWARSEGPAPSGKRQATSKKDLTGPVKYEMIPYNL